MENKEQEESPSEIVKILNSICNISPPPPSPPIPKKKFLSFIYFSEN